MFIRDSLIPTHDTKNFSLVEYPNGFNIKNVAAGLAINIKNIDIAIEIPITCGNFDGNANKPSKKNNAICIIHDTPSK